MPSALSQSYTTQTSTNAASTPVASYTAISTEAQTMVAGTATHTPISVYYCSSHDSEWSFDAQAGQPVEGTITLSQATAGVTISAFILSNQSYTEWLKPANSFCDPTYTGAVSVEWAFGIPDPKQASTVAINWTPTADGKYWLVAETYSSGRVVVTANLTSQVVHTVTSISYSTLSVTSQPLSQEPLTLGSGGLLLGAVVVIAIAGLAAYILLKRRR
jgi:hypothetical protein